MNASTFRPANRFIDRVTVAQAAVEWQGLSQEQQGLVVVNEGLPFLAGVPELEERAAALLDAAQRGKITGLVANEDGYPLRPDAMRLDRDSVDEFISRVDARPTASSASDGEVLLTALEVRARLGGIGRTQLWRLETSGEFERAHAEGPKRWRKSYVDAYVARQGSIGDDDI